MSQPAGSDPCLEWLGFPATQLGSPTTALGLEPGERDPVAVLRAAESRLAALERIDAGPREAARRGLMARITEARDSLLRELAAGAAPGPSTAVPPPPPWQSRPAEPERAAAAPPASGEMFADDASLPAARPTASASATRRRRRERSAAGPVYAVASLLVVAAGSMAIYVATRNTGSINTGEAGVKVVVVDERGRPVSKPAGGRERPRPETPRRQNPTPEPTPQPTPKPEPEPAPPPPDRPDEPMDSVPTGESTPDDAVVTTGEGTGRPEPPPEPAPPPPPGMLEDRLAEVKSALAERDFAAAARGIEQARDLAVSPQDGERVANWDLLVDYTRGFYDYRRRALADVGPGNEFTVLVGGEPEKIGIVENSTEQFVFKFKGRNIPKPPDAIPGNILIAIIEDWFDDNPANNLYLGAYWLTNPEPNLDNARSLWQEAARRGADAASLLSLLDDPLFHERP